MRESFASLLHALRTRAGLSQHALAGRMGTDASMVLRVERGERFPRDRAWVAAAADALSLSPDERDALLVAAGHVPAAVYPLAMARDETLLAVAAALADERVAHVRRQELASTLRRVVAWWRAAQDSAGTPTS